MKVFLRAIAKSTVVAASLFSSLGYGSSSELSITVVHSANSLSSNGQQQPEFHRSNGLCNSSSLNLGGNHYTVLLTKKSHQSFEGHPAVTIEDNQSPNQFYPHAGQIKIGKIEVVQTTGTTRRVKIQFISPVSPHGTCAAVRKFKITQKLSEPSGRNGRVPGFL